jgi:hypothetical protein
MAYLAGKPVQNEVKESNLFAAGGDCFRPKEQAFATTLANFVKAVCPPAQALAHNLLMLYIMFICSNCDNWGEKLDTSYKKPRFLIDFPVFIYSTLRF